MHIHILLHQVAQPLRLGVVCDLENARRPSRLNLIHLPFGDLVFYAFGNVDLTQQLRLCGPHVAL